MPEQPIRVLVVDDHPVVRQGLRTFLSLQEGIEVAGEAADGERAVVQAGALRPDVVVLDLVLPGIDGVETLRRIRAQVPSARVLVLTSFVDDERVFAALEAGASGYLLKDVDPAELAGAVRSVHAGDARLDPGVAARVLREIAQPQRSAAVDRLTERELQVLRIVARGRSNREIARELGVAEKTVKTHVSSILGKLGLQDRTQAAVFAVRHGLADDA